MGSSVDSAKANLVRYQAHLEHCKRARDDAKKSGAYKNAPKDTRMADGRLVNDYDYKVLKAQEYVKQAKESLARAKKSK